MPAAGFIIDPISRFDPEAETTLFLMREAARRRYRIRVCEPQDLFLKGPEPCAEMKEIRLLWPRQKNPFYCVRRRQKIRLAALDILFLRKDPPFDLAYLHHLYMLAPLRGRVPMMNDPLGIMEANEKLFALRFPRWIPETLISSDPDAISRFVQRHRHGTVIKPLHAGGGVGVVRALGNDPELAALLQTATEEGRRPVVCQEFLPGVRRGDKRILLLDGEPLGAFLRIARPGEFRSNLHQGGSFHKTSITPREQKMIREIGPVLKERGLTFAGLDVIDGRLTEINVTSPMGIRELNATEGGHTERRIFDWVLKER